MNKKSKNRLSEFISIIIISPLEVLEGPFETVECENILTVACAVLADGTLLEFDTFCDACGNDKVHSYFEDFCPTKARSPFRHYWGKRPSNDPSAPLLNGPPELLSYPDGCHKAPYDPVLGVTWDKRTKIYEENCVALIDENINYYIVPKTCSEDLACPNDLQYEI